MQKIIRNEWQHKPGESYALARILSHEKHPEGLDVERVRFLASGRFYPKTGLGHIISIIKGTGELFILGENKQQLHLKSGVHLYLPPSIEAVFKAGEGAEFTHVSSSSKAQTRGKQLLVRDETFLAACASGTQSLRWIFTPQYLSRRIFLYHDLTLLSKSGNPVSWFHTTMFDVSGLPENADGEPVFKMSYNTRTEFNVCYDVKGIARVRMAHHPYRTEKQLWGPWLSLDAESTYHLNEADGCLEEECYIDSKAQTKQFLRNKHEVSIVNGYVSLFCLFDPAPIGIERHRPGDYSDYESLLTVLGNKTFDNYQQELAHYDKMLDQLSLS